MVFTLPHTEGSLSQVFVHPVFLPHQPDKDTVTAHHGREWEYQFYVDVVFDNVLKYKQSIVAITPLTKELNCWENMKTKSTHKNRLASISEYYFSKKLKEVAQMNAEGKDVISLGMGRPDMPPSESPYRRFAMRHATPTDMATTPMWAPPQAFLPAGIRDGTA